MRDGSGDLIVRCVRADPIPQDAVRMILAQGAVMEADATYQTLPTFLSRIEGCRGLALISSKFLSASSRIASGNWL